MDRMRIPSQRVHQTAPTTPKKSRASNELRQLSERVNGVAKENINPLKHSQHAMSASTAHNASDKKTTQAADSVLGSTGIGS